MSDGGVILVINLSAIRYTLRTCSQDASSGNFQTIGTVGKTISLLQSKGGR